MAVLCMIMAMSASAETDGYYTYSVWDSKARITDVDTSISGDVTIPSTLGGYSVTIIGDHAFCYCMNLTSLTIPVSVTSLGDWGLKVKNLDIYYGGTVQQWKKIAINDEVNGMKAARIHFSTYGYSDCYCNCHKGGFKGFIWKITLFFNKLFKTNKICSCGASHY